MQQENNRAYFIERKSSTKSHWSYFFFKLLLNLRGAILPRPPHLNVASKLYLIISNRCYDIR